MTKTILKETLHLQEQEIKRYFPTNKKSLTLLEWLDPNHYPSFGTFDLDDTYEFLPDFYQVLVKNMTKEPNWREVISEVVRHNEKADNHLEKWLRAAKFNQDERQESFYSVPFASGLLDEIQGLAPKNTLWSFYVIPLLLTKREIQKIAIQDIYWRKLDYSELYSYKYARMSSELNPPPSLVVKAEQLANPEHKPFTLIEGAFRTAKALEDKATYINCKLIDWSTLKAYIHIQPIGGNYSYQLPDFAESQKIYL